jgi:phosphoribosylamine-glycine ligase
LKKIDFRGDFDINCIVNEKGAYFLEFTPRMGVPATSAQIAIHESSWYDFLKAMADGKQDPMFNYSDKWTIVSWLYTSPFPYVNNPKLNDMYDKMWEGKPPTKSEDINELITHRMSNSEGLPVTFKEPLTKEELHNLHFDGIMYVGKELKVSGPDGHVLTVTGQGNSVDEAAEKTEDLLKKIIVPKRFWRNDFKNSHYHQSREDLTNWGYLNY